MQPNENENTQMASSDAYVKLVEYFESLGYDYDAASELAYEAFKSANQLNSTDKNQDKIMIY